MPGHAWQPTPDEPAAEVPPARAGDRGLAASLLALQRTAGNAAVTSLIRGRRLQRRPLIEADYPSLAALKKEISIVQTPGHDTWVPGWGPVHTDAKVEVSYPKSGFTDVNELSEGTVGETELQAGKDTYGGMAALAWKYPELAWHKGALAGVNQLSKVKNNLTKSAIGHVSDAMLTNLTSRPSRPGPSYAKTQEAIKNMFLHVFGQAIITTLYGRAAADLVGDIHERDQSALIFGGVLSTKEERFAIDNYCDLINNLHGQKWGEQLSASLGVDGDTLWTPTLTAIYASELQKLVAADMGWKMKPFTDKDPVIVKFTDLLNEVVGHLTPAEAAGRAAGRAAAEAAAKAAAKP
jgi:hypothetical protein